ncbi:hypothetical protein ADL02_08650 [Streptomyces sp. NRRL WC-3723]|nr:hypothetical protein ADL02_08650 [Streptomyces sp. NRRL WC-3723]
MARVHVCRVRFRSVVCWWDSGPAMGWITFEVVQAQAVLEFAVVVLDPPAHLRPPHQVGDRGVSAGRLLIQ